ncbi:FAD/NAD(P)-binding domain-containing protein [Heliocybe sulcata]|uniref:FAD/NAD(P)-binding domain-containing protein n=1 Tax=Heliocybe sulcata TaxID=5364 RepID=A0A5C3MYK8_9AGAM|nr:FAD/NAD(P)-binding domain-containing protein [Heliocybe sulcata]
MSFGPATHTGNPISEGQSCRHSALMASFSRTASVSLQFIIIGGGVAGLASAFALRKAGHQVLLLEKASGPAKEGCGFRSPPNMSRILERWGLGAELAQYAIKGSEISFRLAETGEKVGAMVFHEEIMKGFGADWLYLQYGDICEWLHDLAIEAGATIRYGCEVVSIDPYRVSATLSSGETIRADLMIGADGLSSLVRRSVVGRTSLSSHNTSQLYITSGYVSADVIKRHHILRDLLYGPEMPMWMGDRYTIYGHAIHGYQAYSVTIAAPLRRPYRPSGKGQVPELDVDRDSLEPRLRLLLDLMTISDVATPPSQEPLESLVHDSGKVILIGSAANLIPPCQTQDAATGIEDAATLGNLFSRLRSSEQIPSLISAYEEIRQPRLAEVLPSELRKQQQVTLPADSDARVIRDNGLRAVLAQAVLDWEQADEELLRSQWEEYIRMFNYDADEVADDWWIKWGKLMDVEQQNRHEESMRLQAGLSAAQMQISVSRVSDRRMGMRA